MTTTGHSADGSGSVRNVGTRQHNTLEFTTYFTGRQNHRIFLFSMMYLPVNIIVTCMILTYLLII